jgi:hypothetical protein
MYAIYVRQSLDKKDSISIEMQTELCSKIIPDEYNSEFILGLANNRFISSNKGDYNFNVGAGEYGYFAVPSTMKFTTIWVNGFQADVEEVATVPFTNASGHTSTYTILKTGQSSLGTFTATVK